MIVNATAPHLTPLVAWPTMVVASLSTILGITIAKKATPHQKHSTPEKNPLEVRGIIKLGVLIFGLLTLVAVVEKYVGTSAVLMMSFLAGFFELHGITLANATLSSSGGLSNTLASQALLLAVAASFLSKTVIVWILAPIRFATLMTAAESLLIGVGVHVYFWFRP